MGHDKDQHLIPHKKLDKMWENGPLNKVLHNRVLEWKSVLILSVGNMQKLSSNDKRLLLCLTCTIGELCSQIRKTKIAGKLTKRAKWFSGAAHICIVWCHGKRANSILVVRIWGGKWGFKGNRRRKSHPHAWNICWAHASKWKRTTSHPPWCGSHWA